MTGPSVRYVPQSESNQLDSPIDKKQFKSTIVFIETDGNQYTEAVGVLAGLIGALQGVRRASESLLHVRLVGVYGDVSVLYAPLGEFPREVWIGQLVAVGDHAYVQAMVSRVSGDPRELRVQRRFTTRENDAEVVALDEVIDELLHRLEGVHIGRGWIAAEPAEMIAVSNNLDVADVGQAYLWRPSPRVHHLLTSLSDPRARAQRNRARP